MGFAKQNNGVGSHFLLPDPGIKPEPPTLQADSLPSEPPGKSQYYLETTTTTTTTKKTQQIFIIIMSHVTIR